MSLPIHEVWGVVPERAKFIAMDSTGEWFWYADHPAINSRDTGWRAMGSFGIVNPQPASLGDWRQSLVRRP